MIDRLALVLELHRLADHIDQCSEAEYQALEMMSRIVVPRSKPTAGASRSKGIPQTPQQSPEALVATLRQALTRADAEAILTQKAVKKPLLLAVAKQIHAGLASKDNMDRIRERIVIAISSKRDSEAIRGYTT